VMRLGVKKKMEARGEESAAGRALVSPVPELDALAVVRGDRSVLSAEVFFQPIVVPESLVVALPAVKRHRTPRGMFLQQFTTRKVLKNYYLIVDP